MAGQRTRGRNESPGRNKIWTIVCVVLVCAAALLLRGIVIYEIYPLAFKDEIRQYSAEYGQDPYFVSAVICAESGFDETAVSHRGAIGLMQVMPDTGAWAAEKIGMENYSADMLAQPDVNIRIGCWYLSYLNEKFGGDTDKIIAGYNAGPGKVDEWAGDGELSDIPYPETENYLKKVTINYQIYKGLYHEF